MVFAVDPQDEAERKEQRLAIIADHLGFSWTGEWHLITAMKRSSSMHSWQALKIHQTFKCIFKYSRLLLYHLLANRVSTGAWLQWGEDQWDKNWKPQLTSRPKPCSSESLDREGGKSCHRPVFSSCSWYTFLRIIAFYLISKEILLSALKWNFYSVSTEATLIKRLTKINRMDIVHLIESRTSEEETSHTYAEIEWTIAQDHSEGAQANQILWVYNTKTGKL